MSRPVTLVQFRMLIGVAWKGLPGYTQLGKTQTRHSRWALLDCSFKFCQLFGKQQPIFLFSFNKVKVFSLKTSEVSLFCFLAFFVSDKKYAVTCLFVPLFTMFLSHWSLPPFSYYCSSVLSVLITMCLSAVQFIYFVVAFFGFLGSTNLGNLESFQHYFFKWFFSPLCPFWNPLTHTFPAPVPGGGGWELVAFLNEFYILCVVWPLCPVSWVVS